VLWFRLSRKAGDPENSMLFRVLVGLCAIASAAGHFEATPFPKVVQGGVPVAGLTSTEPHGLLVFKLVVPPATTRPLSTITICTGPVPTVSASGFSAICGGSDSKRGRRYQAPAASPATTSVLCISIPCFPECA